MPLPHYPNIQLSSTDKISSLALRLNRSNGARVSQIGAELALNSAFCKSSPPAPKPARCKGLCKFRFMLKDFEVESTSDGDAKRAKWYGADYAKRRAGRSVREYAK
jgi:hypothetical protein